MRQTHSPNGNTVDAALVLSLQKQIISLQKKLDKKSPPNPKDKDVFWHQVSDGVLSTEAAKSDDLVTLKQFYDWNVKFAKKHIRPYVNPKVYGECLNQMTRGLGERISALETQEELRSRNGGHVSKVPITSVR